MTWWQERRRAAAPWLRRSLLLLVLIGSSLAVVTAGARDSGDDISWLQCLVGSVAVASGTEVLFRGRSHGVDTPEGESWETPFRRWLGTGLLVWGLGVFVPGVLAAAGADAGTGHRTGQLVELLAAPILVTGLMTIPRAVGGTFPLLRIALDGGLLAVCASQLCWRLVFSWRLGGVTEPRWTTALCLLFDIAFTAVAVAIAVRDLAVPLIVLAAGFAAFTTGGVLSLADGASPGTAVAGTGGLLWAVCAPVIAWGALTYRPRRRSSDEPAAIDVDPDARATVVTTTTSLLLLGLGVASVLLQDIDPLVVGRADWVSWCFVLAAVGLLGVRELLNSRLRVRLIGRLHQEATSDPLTGLANRRMLTARIAEIPDEERWSLLALDIDGFKAVNDLLGHAVGDRLLCAVGRRLVGNLPRTALVSRIGGDEFAVLVAGGIDQGLVAADLAVTAVQQSCGDVDGVTRLPVSASVGVTLLGARNRPVAPDEPDAADQLSAMSAAAAALQVAKAGGRDRIEVFDGTVAQMRSRRLAVEERLRSAVRAGAISVLFQPVVDLRTGAITGVEALARWTDERLGVVHPVEFVPIAEQTGLVVELGELVLHRTLEQATRHGMPSRGIRVACNVSPLQLRVPDFPRMVEEALATYEIPPHMLLVEVTEAVLVDEDGPAVQNLRRLAEAGIPIAIDDFGTGYSALGYLRRLPAEVLKIDRSLTVALDEQEARAITGAVIDLGHRLGVHVVVEGIETSDVAELVFSMGAGYGQGSLYGWAMPMEEIVRLSRRPSANLRLA